MDPLIQIMDYQKATSLRGLHVIVDQALKEELPPDVQWQVMEHWERHRAKNPLAQNTPVCYLVSYERDGEHVTAKTFTAGYANNQWLNRDDKTGQHTAIADQLHYNPLASWILAVCSDHTGAYALFGNKKYFGNRKVSGFGGFTKPEDLRIQGDGTLLDVNHFIQRKLEEELGSMATHVVGKAAVGLNYIPWVGTKGYDLVTVATLTGSPQDLQHEFSENPQFGKQLIPVRLDPYSLTSFLKSEPVNGELWEPTASCVGGVLTFIASRYGPEELDKVIDAIKEPLLARTGREIWVNPTMRSEGVRISSP